MKLTYFIYLQLTILQLIKHFTAIYADANKQFLTLNLIFFCREKISLSGTPISLPKIADLPIWAQENITCMIKGQHVCYQFEGLYENFNIQWPKPVLLTSSLDHAPLRGHHDLDP